MGCDSNDMDSYNYEGTSGKSTREVPLAKEIIRFKNLTLMFALYGVVFMTMAAVNIITHIGHLETILMSYRVPTAQFQIVVRNCCGHNICIKERHHQEIQWQYLTVKN